jgi:hypothetical protein
MLKTKLKILNGVDDVLMKMLGQNEMVYQISYGIKNSVFDHMFLGWMAIYLNRKIFIFTTKRIIIVKYSGKFKPSELFCEIPYTHIDRVKSTFFRNMEIVFTDGTKSLFTGMPMADQKVFIEVVNKMAESKIEKTNGGTIDLCPHCYCHIESFPAQCPNCKGKFKNPVLTACLSLLFPGIGDIYLGHKGFGILELLTGALVWFGFSAAQFGAAGQLSASKAIIGVAILFVIMHGVDALVTYRTARKGIYPAK